MRQQCDDTYGQRYEKCYGVIIWHGKYNQCFDKSFQVKFVFQNWVKLRSIAYNSIDVSSLLTKINNISTRMQQQKGLCLSLKK